MSLPSPAASPSLKPTELISAGRKRQRSQSMQSDSSSSIKRSASEGPTSATPVPIMTDPISSVDSAREHEIEIDAYMAEQGEDIPAQSGSLTIEEKVARIKYLRDTPMVAGDTWYIISRQWFRTWEIACGMLSDKSLESLQEKDIGPPDNSSLFDSQGNLTSLLVEHIDVEFLPEPAWIELVVWYGQPINPLPRSVISKAFLQTTLELRPPRLKVLVLKDLGPDADIAGPPHSYVTVSIKDPMKTLFKALVSAVTARSNVPYRIWKIEPGEFLGSHFPVSKLASWGAELVSEGTDKTVEDNMIESEDPFVIEFQENGAWIVDASQVVRAPPPSAVHVPPPLFSNDNDFFSRLSNPRISAYQNTKPFRTPSPSRRGSSSKAKESSVAPFKSSGFSKGSSKVIQEPGTLGLGNMGNTCFMNSALQCLAHTKELTDYFLSGVYQEELNPDNPLGMNGAIAEAFGLLLHRIWARDSTSTSYSPREFKSQLQKFAPQFSGYQQHDSQELVAFLLDGLHEDLNRVLKKPYVEKPDWQGGDDLDLELAKLAQTSWDGYMKRNDSVIVDLFQGQYQSTLVCPECEKVSITFDPFMYLTLPLPVNRKWWHVIHYVPWDPSVPHRRVPVEISRDSTFKDLKNLLGRWMGARPKRLLTLEVFNHRFYKNLDDSILCGDMVDNDQIFCFELPCNSRQSRSYKPKDNDPFILPVILTDGVPPRPAYANYSRSTNTFGRPFIVVIERDQAGSVEAMYDAVIERLRRWTVHERELYTWQTDHSPNDGDAVTIPISTVSPIDSMAEIKENGDVSEVDGMVIEGDIADQRILGDDDSDMDLGMFITGTKQGVFNLRLYSGYKDYTAGGYGSSNGRPEQWETRIEDAESGAPLLKEGDAFLCEFDENMKAFYFGPSPYESSRWDEWVPYLHLEYLKAKEVAAAQKSKGITLDDCLAEFTKEEELGEDDLWYCPRCKKHQQATKKFDLWKVPDILAVHLKRFSNSRTLRDKIDTFVDFPIEGLDLTALVGERQVGTRLAQSGADINELGIKDVEEPLIYDLYAVDEHLGGLGGGHYRAYALNHVTQQWYHFDDSYVTQSDASHAVNSNAYLLFYKRRSNTPLGGKTNEKIEEAGRKAATEVEEENAEPEAQLPTPPSESGTTPFPFPSTQQPSNAGYLTPRSNTRSTPTSSPPPLDDGDPTALEAQSDDLIAEDVLTLCPLELASHQFDFPDPSARASPTSSVEVEPDYDDDPARSSLFRSHADIDSLVGNGQNGLPSPAVSDPDMNPFSDMNLQKSADDSMDV